MASDRVPMTSHISLQGSFPPSSAGRDCASYGFISTEIIGVGLKFQPDRRCGHDVVLEAMLFAVIDRRLPRRTSNPHLRFGVTRSVPAGQRIRSQRLLTLELDEPAAGVGFARLGCLAIKFGNAGDGHRFRRGKVRFLNQAFGFKCAVAVVVINRPSFRYVKGGDQ